ncbi:hypothetical protein CMV_003065 [Castanea mollissima]|uniref:Reverse transcriptase domain-containing protein n=1 Tax=Castanea mollissima TaxID=60419 RepID=A0A8J4VX00_9ROSI|nr:hypothetical protein CMV_003065 [Castanea mollissima]
MDQQQGSGAERLHNQQYQKGSIDDLRMDRKSSDEFMEFHIPIDGVTPSNFELNWAISLTVEDSLRLSANVSDQEIHKAIFSLKPYKAPDMDGLHARFFQHFWSVLGHFVIEEIQAVFHSKRIPNYLNRTLVVLIPKREGLETPSHFRPISLCSTVYKVISKVIFNRIQPHMHHLISLLQAAFILGRKGLDNMIIAQEILHSMEKKKGRIGTMALKINLEKAFDRLEWSIVREVLDHFNFPKNIIDIIMACIPSTSVSILFNGRKLEPFTPTRGIRQGDPLSPYIFILCLEYLGILILDKIADNTWKPVKASREANRATDSLAKIGCAQEECFVSFVTPPLPVMEALNFGIAHVAASSSPSIIDTRLPTG